MLLKLRFLVYEKISLMVELALEILKGKLLVLGMQIWVILAGSYSN
jgi:hypothetical protein